MNDDEINAQAEQFIKDLDEDFQALGATPFPKERIEFGKLCFIAGVNTLNEKLGYLRIHGLSDEDLKK